MASLPPELYHHLGSQIPHPPTLASLSLCSKSFHQIFTPFLYTHIRLTTWQPGDTLATIARLSHLTHTQSLYIGPDAQREDGGALLRCAEKMVHLTDLAIIHALPAWSWHFRPNDDRDVLALTRLAERGTLRCLQLTCTDPYSAWDFPLPAFRNLRKLVLEGMAEQFAHMASLVRVLVANPALEELGLMEALSPEETMENHGQLERLCRALRVERSRDPGIQKLKLKKLRLGLAYRPERENDSDSASHVGVSYIDSLTDLSFLEELTLQNAIIYEWHSERRLWEDFHLLDSATNLRRLTLSRLTGAALEFIQRLQQRNPDVLREIAGLDDTDNDGMESQSPLVESSALFAHPPAKLGPGWRTAVLSCALGGFAEFCGGVEELACFLPGDELDDFKTTVLPTLTRLGSLTVHGENADGEVLAGTLFRVSCAAWERRGEGERLRRIGVGGEVYGFGFPGVEEGVELGVRRVVRL